MKPPSIKSIATAALLALATVSVHAQTTYDYVGEIDNVGSEWDVTTNWATTLAPGNLFNGDGAIDDIVNLVNNFGTGQHRIRLLDSVQEIGTLNIGGEGEGDGGNTGNTQLMVRGGGDLIVNGLTTLGAVGPVTAGQRGGLIQLVGGSGFVTLGNVVSGSTAGGNNLQVNDPNATLEISGDIDTAAIRTDGLNDNEIDLKIHRGTLLLNGAGAQTLNVESFDVVNVNANNANTTVTIETDKTINALLMEIGRNSSNNTQNNRTVTGTLNISGGTVTTVNDVKLANLGGATNTGNVANGNVNVGDAINPGTFLIGGELRLSALNQAGHTGVSNFTVDNAGSVVTIGRGIEFASMGNRDAAAATITINDGLMTVTSEIERSDLGDSTLNVLGGELVLLDAEGGPRAVKDLFHTGGTIDYLVYGGMPSFDTSTATLAAGPGGSLIDLTTPSDAVSSTTDTATSITTGNWEAPANWDTGVLPAESAGIVSNGASVTLLTSDAFIAGDSGAAALTPAADADWDLAQNANDITVTRTGASYGSGPARAVIADGTVTRNSDLNIQNAAGVGADATQLDIEGTGSAQLDLFGGSLDLILGGSAAQGVVNQNGAGSLVQVDDLLFGGPGGVQGGTYNLNGGSLNVLGDIIEDTPGVNNAQLIINAGTNPLNMAAISSTGDITVQRLAVGQNNGSNATQTLGGNVTTTGTLAVGGSVDAGSDGIGTLTFDSSALVSVASIDIAADYAGQGTLNIDGAVTSAGRVYVAGDQTGDQDSTTVGTINISSTGSLTVTSGNTEIGRDGTGFFNVDGGSYTQLAGNLVIGQNGGADPETSIGTVTFTNGAQVDLQGGTSNLNLNGGGGTVTQSGATTYVHVTNVLNFSDSANPSTYNLDGGDLEVDGNIMARGGNGLDTFRITDGTLFQIGVINFAGGTNNLIHIVGDSALIQTGGLTLSSGATVRFEFTPSSTVSFFDIVGPVTLNDATLELTGTLPTTGSVTLIDGDTAPTGTFAGIPEGGYFEQSGQNYQITYAGGDGFDTVITAVAGPIVQITADSSSVVEGGTAGYTLTRVGPLTGNFDVTVAYSGSAADGSDYSGALFTVTMPDGVTTVDLDLTTSIDGDYEGCEVIVATLTGTNDPDAGVGTPFSASIDLLDANVTPTGNGELEQTIAGTGTVAINDIVVTDPDVGYGSNYDTTTSPSPIFEYTGRSDVSVFSDGSPNDDGVFTTTGVVTGPGFALDADFIPAAGDLDGTVLIWEIGGSSNGTSLYLLEGIPHLLIKANGQPDDAPTDDGSVSGVFTDLDFNTPNASSDSQDDTVVVPLSTTPLTAGQPASLAFHVNNSGGQLASVTYSVDGAAPATATLLGNNANNNWLGNQSVQIAQGAGSGVGGANNGTGTPFAESSITDLADGPSSMGCLRFWNESSGSIGTASGPGQTITATLTIEGWTAPSDGVLTGLTGGAGGVYTTTGDAGTVNATLAAMTFVESTATYPVVITVLIEDDLGASTSGFIVINDTPPATVYVDDDFAGAPGSAIADADSGPNTPAATFQSDAFNNFADALLVVADGGTIVASDGTYPELVNLTGTTTLRITQSGGPVTIDSLSSEAGNTISIQPGNTLVTGDDAGDNTIAGTITGLGTYTKTGTDVQILTGANTLGAFVTVSAGTLRVGDNASTIATLGGATGPSLTVALDAVLQFRPAVDRTMTVARTISGDGAVASEGDGTVEFTGTGPNTFTGGFTLGDGANSNFDGVDQGTKAGFVVVNDSGHLGTGLITSRGGQLQAGTTGINITNDIEVGGGGLRMGGTNSFELSGKLAAVGGTRGFSHVGLEGTVITLSGGIDLYDEAAGTGRGLNFEGSNNRDNGDFIVTGDISGTDANVQMQGSFDDGVIALLGTNTYTGTTIVNGGVVDGALFLQGSHTGGGIYNVNGGFLSGTGTTDSTVNVNAGGIIVGGASATSAGVLSTGDLNILGTLLVGLEDTSMPAGIGGYSQINVTGTVDVTTATLAFLEDGATIGTETITIIANDAADGVSGIFTGLPEGATTTVNASKDAQISYVGDTGNDVTLTFVDSGIPDTDGDGISDAYELANTSPPSTTALDPTEDDDGDGVNNFTEAQFGTAAIDGASFPRLVFLDPIGATDATVRLTPVFEGLTYQLTNSTDLAIFSDTGPPVTATSGDEGAGFLDFTDPTNVSPLEAFRVQVMNPNQP